MADDYRYPDQLGLELPLLILTPGRGEELVFQPGREWLRLAHQSAGIACHQPRLVATVLQPQDQALVAMHRLEKRYYETNLGAFGLPLSSVVEYRDVVRELFGPEADCEWSWPALEEGLYPLDLSPELLRAICADELPEDLDELVDWGQGRPAALARAFGSLDRWRLFVLGENSD